ncbi:MAG: PEP-CTERM sorting domain-containing protein [Methylococcaceae bacterium]|nr:PEP-CTERM sorting domain-containing protein [Methylococcaceae bacterium]MDP2391831.1 PEP-CTERM sorting domain-containing protein [Methylococcaceae bacterium]MDP3018930.1 PEP-CTERM sorting domain-containing protein [Methylococcaceae bacterium]MDP3391491.1 PEP-CTERM sorting domain-containing protein [Methylococcaceae bacterium]MDZ4155820.1 PEP-CTERM sorting domain-containing protein [Methylococcales bacterium]
MKVMFKKLGIQALLATAFFASATASQAGNFVPLTDGVSGLLSTANGGIITGSTNSNADKLYIETSASYLSGYDPSNTSGEVVADSLSYRAFSGTNTISTGTLTLLDWQVTRDVTLGLPNQFDYFDFVYRDSADNNLVFGTRALNQLDNNEEVNFLYRYGFTGLETASAWTFSTDDDLRQYQAARTDSISTSTSNLSFDADAVRQRSDVSLSEGNPWSGLFLVKTNASDYILGDKAIGFAQAGEEGQAVVRGYIGGFVPTAVVPLPGTFALIATGLGFLGLSARRGKKA